MLAWPRAMYLGASPSAFACLFGPVHWYLGAVWLQSECLRPFAWHSAFVSWRRCSPNAAFVAAFVRKVPAALSYKCLSYETLELQMFELGVEPLPFCCVLILAARFSLCMFLPFQSAPLVAIFVPIDILYDCVFAAVAGFQWSGCE